MSAQNFLLIGMKTISRVLIIIFCPMKTNKIDHSGQISLEKYTKTKLVMRCSRSHTSARPSTAPEP